MTERGPAVAILIVAAGAARRMRGADKLLEPVTGVPQLRRLAVAALATGAPVVVTLAPDRPARAAVLEGLALRQVTVADAAEGMAASIRAGLAALPADVAGVMVVLADMPEIDGGDLGALMAAFRADPAAILRAAAADGTPGHPVIFPRALFGDLAQVRGDTGARAVLGAGRVPVRLHPLPGRRALTDLDTPEDWAAWRAAGGPQPEQQPG